MQNKTATLNELQECLKQMADLTEKNRNLLAQLDERLTAREIEEWRFQTTIVGSLSRIEAMAKLLNYSDLINFHLNPI